MFSPSRRFRGFYTPAASEMRCAGTSGAGQTRRRRGRGEEHKPCPALSSHLRVLCAGPAEQARLYLSSVRRAELAPLLPPRAGRMSWPPTAPVTCRRHLMHSAPPPVHCFQCSGDIARCHACYPRIRTVAARNTPVDPRRQPEHCAQCSSAIAAINPSIATNAPLLSRQSTRALRRYRRPIRRGNRTYPRNQPEHPRQSCVPSRQSTHASGECIHTHIGTLRYISAGSVSGYETQPASNASRAEWHT